MSKKITIPVGKIYAIATIGSALAANYLVYKATKRVPINKFVKYIGCNYITGVINKHAVEEGMDYWNDDSMDINVTIPSISIGKIIKGKVQDNVPCPVDFNEECVGEERCPNPECHHIEIRNKAYITDLEKKTEEEFDEKWGRRPKKEKKIAKKLAEKLKEKNKEQKLEDPDMEIFNPEEKETKLSEV